MRIAADFVSSQGNRSPQEKRWLKWEILVRLPALISILK